jgi:hypothetical protein
LQKAAAFLKKSGAKNFCSLGSGDVETSHVKTNKSFFGSFFSKKELLAFLEKSDGWSGPPHRGAPPPQTW